MAAFRSNCGADEQVEWQALVGCSTRGAAQSTALCVASVVVGTNIHIQDKTMRPGS